MRKRDIIKENAYKHFWPELNGNCKPGFVLHHKDPSWKYFDKDRYDKWDPNDLIPMENGEHIKWHSLNDPNWQDKCGFKTGEENPNFNNALGFNGPTHPFFGKHHTEEQKKKWSQERSGEGNPMFGKSSWEKCTEEEKADRKRRYSNSMKGKNVGKTFWTDGKVRVFKTECPEGFRPLEMFVIFNGSKRKIWNELKPIPQGWFRKYEKK